MLWMFTRIAMVGGFIGMFVGLFTDCRVLTIGAICYFVGFLLYLLFIRNQHDTN